MKKIIVLLCIVAASTSLKAQTGVPDTLVYLQSIIDNKIQFIGQPFSKLLDSLKIQIKFHFPFASNHYDKNKETSTSFSFFFPQTSEQFYLTYPHLEIYWQSALDAEQSRALRSQYRSTGWNQQIDTHYSSNIIAEIKVRE